MHIVTAAAEGFATVVAVDGQRGHLAINTLSGVTIAVHGTIHDRNARYHVRASLFSRQLADGHVRSAFLTQSAIADVVYANGTLQIARERDLPDHIIDLIVAAAREGVPASAGAALPA